MLPTLDIDTQQKVLMDLIFENKLREMMQLVPLLPTLNFIDLHSGDTPLILAVSTSEKEVIEYLLLRGADPNFSNNQTLPLVMAVERSVEADKYWADTNLETEQEDPLVIVELLLKYGGDFNKRAPSGDSAVDYARQVHHNAEDLFDHLTRESGTSKLT